jgi:hypothetical protein
MRQPVALKDPLVVPKLVEFSRILGNLEALQYYAESRCRHGDKDACASVMLIELFRRATVRNGQLHTEASALRRAMPEQP